MDCVMPTKIFPRWSACWLLWAALLAGCAYVPTYDSTDDPAYRPELRAGNNGLRYIDGQLFYLYVPQAVLDDPAGGRILVTVHGDNGRLERYDGERIVRLTGMRWAGLAERNNWVVLSPQFDETRFDDDYQRLNLDGELRADLRLHELVELVGELLPQIGTERLLLFGFAGGGEFVHRYAMLHPGRVERAVAAGAGWYTFPDPELPFPLGVRGDSLPADLAFDTGAFATTPLLLLVGDAGGSGGSLARATTLDGQRYDLLEMQGDTRAQRAQNWFDAMRGIDTDVDSGLRLEIMPATGQVVSEDLRERSQRFLSE